VGNGPEGIAPQGDEDEGAEQALAEPVYFQGQVSLKDREWTLKSL